MGNQNTLFGETSQLLSEKEIKFDTPPWGHDNTPKPKKKTFARIHGPVLKKKGNVISFRTALRYATIGTIYATLWFLQLCVGFFLYVVLNPTLCRIKGYKTSSFMIFFRGGGEICCFVFVFCCFHVFFLWGWNFTKALVLFTFQLFFHLFKSKLLSLQLIFPIIQFSNSFFICQL